jgi:hypothetical protein
MMNLGSREVAFRAKIEQAGAALNAVDLLLTRAYWPDYTEMAKDVRKFRYADEYQYYESRSLYDFRLIDGALLQFKHAPDANAEVSFCFYESPLAVEDFDSFANRLVSSPDERAEYLEVLQEDYEQYLSSAELKRSITTIRYDHSPPLYAEGRHPVSHVHIGRDNEIRLGTAKIMNPISFTLFVLRQMYPDKWVALLSKDSIGEYVKHVRAELPAVEQDYLGGKNEFELYLK